VLCPTGGTTGLPKAAVLTHGNVAWNSINTVMSWGLRPDDVTVLNAPLFHTAGLNVLTAPLDHIGATSIVCRGFDPGQVFDLVRDAGVSLLFGVPTMFVDSAPRPLGGGRLLAAAAGHQRRRALPAAGLRAVPGAGRRLPDRLRPDRGRAQHLLAAGVGRGRQARLGRRPLFHVDVRVVDEGGRDCGPGEVGELLVREPHVCAGYWNRPEETARAIRDGWLHTGDLARRDAEGDYWIVGRAKYVIISGGENVYPAEVEGVLAAHPAVAEVALIGAPDPRWGEVPLAVVAPRPGQPLEPGDLIASARDAWRGTSCRGGSCSSRRSPDGGGQGGQGAAEAPLQRGLGDVGADGGRETAAPADVLARDLMPTVRAGDLVVSYFERGSGAPVVFLHGNWATGSWWEPVLARLPAGWRGLAYDLRGRGLTTGPDSDYGIPSLAADLRAFADALGLGPLHLVGHSLGSAVAMQFALEHPGWVRSLAAVAPAWVDGMPRAALTADRQRLLKADPALFARASRAVAPTAPDDDFWRRLVVEGHRQRLSAALGAVNALSRWRPGDRLRSIACPKLVVGGAADLLIPAPVVARAAAALGARRVTLPGVGHSPNIEAPDALVRCLLPHFARS
jgi:pimeloyl-ACP methyl ester carboxylesterase